MRKFKHLLDITLMMMALVTWTTCGKPPIVRDFPVETLLLTAAELPPRWHLQGHYVTGCASKGPCPRGIAKLPLSPELAARWQRNGTDGAKEDVFAEFDLISADDHTVSVHGSQGILLYRTPDIAQSQYHQEVDIYQFSSSGHWEEITRERFTSEYAKAWRIGCNRESPAFKEKCLYFAVYEEFLVDLSWIIRDTDAGNSLNQDAFLALVRTLDQKIGHRVYNINRASQ